MFEVGGWEGMGIWSAYSLFICALKNHCSIHHLLWVVVIRILSSFCNVTSSNFTVWSTNTFKSTRTYTHYHLNTIKPHNQPSSVKCMIFIERTAKTCIITFTRSSVWIFFQIQATLWGIWNFVFCICNMANKNNAKNTLKISVYTFVCLY